jgi:proline iminopeptidase
MGRAGLHLAALALTILVVAVAPGVVRAQARDLAVPSGEVLVHARVVGPSDASSTVLAVHGGPGLDQAYLWPLAWLAAADRRVVFYDQRGTGASTRPVSGDYGLPAQVADLDAVRRAVGAERVHLLGHSWGTVVALAYAAAHPEAVASLILVGMGAPDAAADRRSFGARFGARKAELQRAGLIAKGRPVARGDDCMPVFDAILPVHFADARHPGARRLAGSYHCDVGRLTLAAAGEWDFRSVLSTLPVPFLLVVGDADANFAGARETARLVPPERFSWGELRGCGHFPWIECPEPFFATVLRFLTQTAAD